MVSVVSVVPGHCLESISVSSSDRLHQTHGAEPGSPVLRAWLDL